MTASGTNFSTVVASCTIPPSRAPRMLVAVSSQISAMPTSAPSRLSSPTSRPEHGQVAHEGDGDRGVAGPDRDPVAPGGLEADEVAERALGVGVRAALAWKRAAEVGEDERQQHRAGAGEEPAEHRDRAGGAGQRGRQQEDARADHVADHQRGRHPEADRALELRGAVGRRRRDGLRGNQSSKCSFHGTFSSIVLPEARPVIGDILGFPVREGTVPPAPPLLGADDGQHGGRGGERKQPILGAQRRRAEHIVHRRGVDERTWRASTPAMPASAQGFVQRPTWRIECRQRAALEQVEDLEEHDRGDDDRLASSRSWNSSSAATVISRLTTTVRTIRKPLDDRRSRRPRRPVHQRRARSPRPRAATRA